MGNNRVLKIFLYRDGYQIKEYIDLNTPEGLDRLCNTGESWKSEDIEINTIKIISIRSSNDLNTDL